MHSAMVLNENSDAVVQLGDAGLSITKIYTVSFVGQARLYLRIVEEEFGNEARWLLSTNRHAMRRKIQ